MTQPLSNYEVDEDALSLVNTMNTLLENLVSVYASYNVPLPSRRYWTIGESVTDCEQAVISFMQIYLGTPGDEAVQPQPCNGPKSMVVTINIARAQNINKNTGNAPSAEKIQGDAEWAVVDTFLIMDNLQALNPWGPGGAPRMIATANVPDPTGGYQVAQVQLTMLVP